MTKEQYQDFVEQLVEVPCDSIISNHSLKREPGVSYLQYWKRRRNANKALRMRLRMGEGCFMLINPKTMSVVTDRELSYKYTETHR